jgi:hypothetical protein
MVGNKAVTKFLESMGTAFGYVTSKLTDFMKVFEVWLGEGNHAQQVANVLIAALEAIGVAAGLLLSYLGGKALLAALTSPFTYAILAIVAGVALIILAFDDLNAYTEGRDSVIGRLKAWAENPVNATTGILGLLHQTLWLLTEIDKFGLKSFFDNKALSTTEMLLQSIVGIFREIGISMGLMKPLKDLSDIAYEADVKANPIKYGAQKLGPMLAESFAGFRPMTAENLTAATSLPQIQAPYRHGNLEGYQAPITSNITINAANADAQDVAAEVERQQQALIEAAQQNFSRTEYVTP